VLYQTGSSAQFFKMKNLVFIGGLLLSVCYLPGCNNEPREKHAKRPVDHIKAIPGKSEPILAEVAEKGKVLISYSDCYTCHKIDQQSIGPTFSDIAKRYPVNKIYIEMLARKVINGGSGSWGYAVMDPHPKLALEDSKLMVTYILSMKK
jgi:cytochrome c